MEIAVASEKAMRDLAARFAAVLPPGTIVYLRGPLGVGKTTFVRGVLRALGYDRAVHSPTYTLLETYQSGNGVVCHCDLYRLTDPSELEYLGLRERLDGTAVCLIELPERGLGELPPADIEIDIAYADGERRLRFTTHGAIARDTVTRLAPSERRTPG
jgi:tRNA threonylcarbamoyladenosine biosynthesis protein TsaE